MNQGATQTQFLFHATGQLPYRPVAKLQQTRAAEQIVDPAVPLGLGLAKKPREEFKVLDDRKRGIEVSAQPLRHEGDAGTNRDPMPGIGHVAAQHLDSPILQRPCPHDETQQGRLADAIRPDHADDPPNRQLQRDPVQRQRLAISQVDVGEPDGHRVLIGGGHAQFGTCRARRSGQTFAASSRT